MAYRPHMCCICGERQSKFYRSWLCGWCWYEYPDLQKPFREWPEWAKALKRQEQNERRLARRTPYTRAAFNILEGAPNDDDTGPNSGYEEHPSQQVHTPLERWSEAMHIALGDEHDIEAELLAAHDAREDPARVKRALAEMAPEDRRVLELRYYREPPYTQAEIGEILGVSQPTARNRLRDAEIRLAARLEAPESRLQELADEYGRNLARVLAEVL